MICFVILHYLSIEETQKCVRSLKKIESGNYKIIIVDNASPNHSGVILADLYNNDSKIDVILNNTNMGYAVGNNVGYTYCKERYSPDFIIILNNDVEIVDCHFIKKVNDIFEREKFDILGPDIYSTSFDVHQSPKRLSHYSINEVISLNMKYKKIIKHKNLLKIRCYMKKNFFLRKFLYQRERKQIDYNRKYYNVPLHGAVVIFSKRYISKFEKAFYDKTFFYFEMEILDFISSLNNLKVVYDPSIQVLHHQNVSTNIAYDNIWEKTIFSYKSNIKSTEAFIRLFDSYRLGD